MLSVERLNTVDHWTLQQSNDPKHTSKSTKAWLRKRPWNALAWPIQSPDLNPTENLWWDLKNVVAARTLSNITELEVFACEEWAKILIERCKKPVNTYQKHFLEVIKANGAKARG